MECMYRSWDRYWLLCVVVAHWSFVTSSNSARCELFVSWICTVDLHDLVATTCNPKGIFRRHARHARVASHRLILSDSSRCFERKARAGQRVDDGSADAQCRRVVFSATMPLRWRRADLQAATQRATATPQSIGKVRSSPLLHAAVCSLHLCGVPRHRRGAVARCRRCVHS
jgi:hypothetical protein